MASQSILPRDSPDIPTIISCIGRRSRKNRARQRRLTQEYHEVRQRVERRGRVVDGIAQEIEHYMSALGDREGGGAVMQAPPNLVRALRSAADDVCADSSGMAEGSPVDRLQELRSELLAFAEGLRDEIKTFEGKIATHEGLIERIITEYKHVVDNFLDTWRMEKTLVVLSCEARVEKACAERQAIVTRARVEEGRTNRTVRELLDESGEMREQIEEMDRVSRIRDAKIEQFETRASHAEAVVQAKQVEIEHLRERLSQAEKSNGEKDLEIEQIRRQVSQVDESRRTKDAELEQMCRQLSNAEAARQEKDGEIEQIRMQMSTLEECSRAKDIELSRMHSRVGKAEEASYVKDVEVTRMRGELQVAQGLVAVKEKEIARLYQSAAQLQRPDGATAFWRRNSRD